MKKKTSKKGAESLTIEELTALLEAKKKETAKSKKSQSESSDSSSESDSDENKKVIVKKEKKAAHDVSSSSESNSDSSVSSSDNEVSPPIVGQKSIKERNIKSEKQDSTSSSDSDDSSVTDDDTNVSTSSRPFIKNEKDSKNVIADKVLPVSQGPEQSESDNDPMDISAANISTPDDSDSDSNSPITQTESRQSQERHRRPLRYPVATEYAEVNFDGTKLYKEDIHKDNEFYLIKVPYSFDSNYLNNFETAVGKRMELPQKDENTFSYSLFASVDKPIQGSGLSVLLPSKHDKKLHHAANFKGTLNVNKHLSVDDYTIPKDKDVKGLPVPEGLKQRFLPFGSDSPLKSQKGAMKRKQPESNSPVKKKKKSKHKHS